MTREQKCILLSGSEWFIWDDNSSMHGYDVLENQSTKPSQRTVSIQEGPGITDSQVFLSMCKILQFM